MSKGSKFDDLFEEKGQREQTTDVPAIVATEPDQPESPPVGEGSHTAEVRGEPRQRRKSTGKRSNPDWQPFTAFGRTATLRQVEVKLITLGHKNKLSDLLEDLMTEWLKSPRSPQEH